MIEISNLRTVDDGEYTKLIVDISSDVVRLDNESQIWIGVEKKNKALLENKVYNAFLLLPLYMSMYYHTDLRIHGEVSKVLYKNLLYIQAVIASFSAKLTKQRIIVDGYASYNKAQVIRRGG